jgi:Ni/Co efflux regulator RcnB
MKIRSAAQFAGIALLSALTLGASGAQALSLKECSEKYNAAKSGGTLKGSTWNEFRKSFCGTPEAAPAADAKKADTPAAKPADAKKADAPAAKPATVTDDGKVFPKALDAKYASEKPSKQRMHTCLDQYKANKLTNSNGGLKWIMKGGGYYSECNKLLKGKA